MGKIENRQSDIRNILSTVENMSVEALAERLLVTGATIRKDLKDMEARHEVSRSRGLVSLVRPHIVDLDVQDKIFINAESKNAIGTMAAALIRENDSIMMTSGTTIEAMARHVVAKGYLNVLTPSMAVALTLTQKKGVEVFVLGGHLNHNSLSVRDEYSIRGLDNTSCTKLFLSCDGLDFNSGVMTAMLEEARLTAHMIAVAPTTILLADSSKVGMTGFGKICRLKDIDMLITDPGMPEGVRHRLELEGIRVIIADGSTTAAEALEG